MAAPVADGGSDLTIVRGANRGLVIDLFRREGPMSRADAAKRTGLAKPTVSAIVEELQDSQHLRQVGIGDAGPAGGRRPVLYAFNTASTSVLGLQIGVERTSVVLADAVGTEMARDSIPTAGSAALALTRAAGLGTTLLDTAGAPSLSAVGVCIPGLIRHPDGWCVLAPNLGWRDVDVVGILRDLLPAPAIVHNVSQAVLAAEHIEGAVQAVDSAVLLYEDQGIGAAILADGHLFVGTQGMAAEIGHCKVPGADGPCRCGGSGCLETVAATPAVLARAAAVDPSSARARSLAQLALHGSEAVDRVLEDAGSQIGAALAWLVNLVNPGAVVLAGPFAEAGQRFHDALQTRMTLDALPEATPADGIRLSTLRDDAPLRGAVLLALHAATFESRVLMASPALRSNLQC